MKHHVVLGVESEQTLAHLLKEFSLSLDWTCHWNVENIKHTELPKVSEFESEPPLYNILR